VVFPPLAKTLKIGTTYRLIITTQNEIDGLKGLVLPSYGFQNLQILTHNEMLYARTYIPKLKQFNFFECYSLISNMGLKNMFTIRFTPGQAVPPSGFLSLWVPTINEWGNFLFDDDLGTGKTTNSPINCYARSGFLANVILSCYLVKGSRLLGTPVQIKIVGTWTSPLLITGNYVIDIDEFYNPTLVGDNNHIEMRFESYDASSNLLD
jgi:hypothetical protein